MLTGQHLKTQVTSSMVCGTFLKNGKPDNSMSCQVFDYEKDPGLAARSWGASKCAIRHVGPAMTVV